MRPRPDIAIIVAVLIILALPLVGFVLFTDF